MLTRMITGIVNAHHCQLVTPMSEISVVPAPRYPAQACSRIKVSTLLILIILQIL